MVTFNGGKMTDYTCTFGKLRTVLFFAYSCLTVQCSHVLYLLVLGIVGSWAGRRLCVVGLSLLVDPVLGDAAVRGV